MSWLVHYLTETYPGAWMSAFLFTQVIEVPIYLIFLGSRPWRERLWLAWAPSAITHPIVWFVIAELPFWPSGTFWPMAAGAESFAVLVEAAFFFVFLEPRDARRAFGLALLGNSVSFGLGLVSHDALGWP